DPGRRLKMPHSLTQSSRQVRWLLHAASLAGLLLIWSLLSWLGDSRLFPSPLPTAAPFPDMVVEGQFFYDAPPSGGRVLAGFLIGGSCGVLFGILTGRLASFDLTLGQVLVLLRPIPSIAIVPFVIVWVGIDDLGKLLIIAWAAVFPTWIATHLGV